MVVVPTNSRMTLGDESAPPRTANEQIRENVRALMDLRRWKQADLAERLGRSQPWLSKRLTGKTPFHMSDLDALSAVFSLSQAEVLQPGFGKWDRRSGEDRRRVPERRRRSPETT